MNYTADIWEALGEGDLGSSPPSLMQGLSLYIDLALRQ